MESRSGEWTITPKVDQCPTASAIQGMEHMAAVRKNMMGTLAMIVRYSLETYSSAGEQDDKVSSALIYC